MKKTRRGRPRKYPIHTLEVGGSIVIPWLRDPKTGYINQTPLLDCLKQERRRFGKEFYTSPVQDGLKVTRVR